MNEVVKFRAALVALLVIAGLATTLYGYRYALYAGKKVRVFLTHDGWIHLTSAPTIEGGRVYRVGFNLLCIAGVPSNSRPESIHKEAPGYYEAKGLCLRQSAIQRIEIVP